MISQPEAEALHLHPWTLQRHAHEQIQTAWGQKDFLEWLCLESKRLQGIHWTEIVWNPKEKNLSVSLWGSYRKEPPEVTTETSNPFEVLKL